MLSACAQSGILAFGLIACRHNAARVSMMSFSSAEMRAEPMCYHRRAYAPRTQVIELKGFNLAVLQVPPFLAHFKAPGRRPSKARLDRVNPVLWSNRHRSFNSARGNKAFWPNDHLKRDAAANT